jgi:hypothetical protein
MQPLSLQIPPFGANDCILYHENKIEKVNATNWDPNSYKLILFYNNNNDEIFNQNLNSFYFWTNEFNKLNTNFIIASTETIGNITPLFENTKTTVLSSYILPLRLNLIDSGITKNANVIITPEGNVIVQEVFNNINRNIPELHRIVYSLINNDVFSESWSNPMVDYSDKEI